MLSFRKRIAISHLAVFLVLSSLLYPLVKMTVRHIIHRSGLGIGEGIVIELRSQPNRAAEIEWMDNQINHLIFSFVIAILIISIVLIGVTTTIDNIISNYILRPVQQILEALHPFKEGKEELIPKIVLSREMQKGDFGKLASILNSLRRRIQNQLEHLTQQREETEEILESLGEGVIAVDPQAKVTFINKTACQMLEIPKEDILHRRLDVLSSEISKESQEMILHALEHSESNVQTLVIRDSAPLFFDLIAAPLAHKTGAILVIQDKTSAYRILEVGKDFVANASHELRTPITIIRGFAETLQDIPDLSKEMLHEITEKIVRTCIRLDNLVRSLIVLSDIEHIPQDRLQSADLIAIVKKCREHLLLLSPKAVVRIETKLKRVPIFVDVNLIEMAVTNILENAVKYSPGDAEIKMQIEQVDEEVRLSIEDHGIGISEGDLLHIFDRFYTVDKARSRKSGGAGLGLSIVKNVIEKHRGKIYANSELGKGSTFTIILPLFKNKRVFTN